MVKKSIKKLFVGLAAFSAASMYADSNFATSRGFFQPRAFSANLAREMLMEGSKHRDSEGWYGTFSATAAYQRQWNQSVEANTIDPELATTNGLGAFPFWSGSNTMTVGDNSDAQWIDAYQFGLGPVTTTGSVTLNPLVYQAGSDFMFTVGSSANEPCFFAKIKAPVGVYNINPNLTEVAVTPVNYAQGSLAQNGTASYQPSTSMTQAFAGNLANGEIAQGDFIPMQYGLLNGQQSTGAKFGDIEMTAGYRFVSNEDNSFSVAVRAAAPTGGKATGQYMLEPVFGRGGNWGLGGYVDGHVRLWEGNNENSLVLKVMGYAEHLFNAATVRQFDLTENGGGSKYLLVANYANGVYQSQIQNLVNVSTLGCNSSFGVEGDVVATLSYAARGWAWDLGYEFFGRSAETLEITEAFAEQQYAILGRQGVGNSGAGATGTTLCQPTATISSSSARTNTVSGAVVNATVATNRISAADLNVAGAQQFAALTSKVFTKVSYEWVDSNYRPHLGLMGEFEISNSQNNALPQWAIALIGGVSF